jgi:aryl-alcohol dehydrogenase-like predicted oxidoreductase
VGFGCGSVGAATGYKANCALIEAAYDAGFRYFDVAPSYGHGQAERIVGDVLHSVRDNVTLVTKVGIAHPIGSGSIRVARRLLSPIKRVLPGFWSRGAKWVRNASATDGDFLPSEVCSSFAESLRRLRVDHVEGLLLHEVHDHDISPALLDVLGGFVSRGLSKRIGLGTSLLHTERIIQQYPNHFDLVQVNHYWGGFDQRLCERRSVITHGCIRSGMNLIKSAQFGTLLADDSSLSLLTEIIKDIQQVPMLLLIAGLQKRHLQNVLVASSRIERIRAFIKISESYEANVAAAMLNECMCRLAPTVTRN